MSESTFRPEVVNMQHDKIELVIGIALVLSQVASMIYQAKTGRKVDLLSKVKEALR